MDKIFYDSHSILIGSLENAESGEFLFLILSKKNKIFTMLVATSKEALKDSLENVKFIEELKWQDINQKGKPIKSKEKFIKFLAEFFVGMNLKEETINIIKESVQIGVEKL